MREVLAFAQQIGKAKCTMVTKKKYVMPEIDLEGAGPQAAELIAFVKELVAHANVVCEQAQTLQAELVQLKKAQKRASGGPK